MSGRSRPRALWHDTELSSFSSILRSGEIWLSMLANRLDEGELMVFAFAGIGTGPAPGALLYLRNAYCRAPAPVFYRGIRAQLADPRGGVCVAQSAGDRGARLRIFIRRYIV